MGRLPLRALVDIRRFLVYTYDKTFLQSLIDFERFCMKFIGIDIGGMTIKGGIVDENGIISTRKTIVTSPGKEDVLIVKDIANLIEDLVVASGLQKSDFVGVGLGCPGSVYDEKGIVRYSCNINFRNTPMAKMLADMTGIKNVKLSNDANCAALAETMFGAGKGAKIPLWLRSARALARVSWLTANCLRATALRARKADISKSISEASLAGAERKVVTRRTRRQRHL